MMLARRYIIQRNTVRSTEYMTNRGTWTRRSEDAETFASQRKAVRFGLRFMKTFLVFPVK